VYELTLPRFDGGTFCCQIDSDPEMGALEHLLASTYQERRKYIIIDAKLETIIPNLRRILAAPGTVFIAIDPTEALKTLATCEAILGRILHCSPSKDDLIVNVGGGALMNIGGFLAGIILRGMDFVHVPTTLTGQIDVCLGGKQAVNANGYKNQVGLYRDPLHCYCNTTLLGHLGAPLLKAQLVEGMKLCLARSASDYWAIYEDLDRVDCTDCEWLSALVPRLLALKVPLVRSDPFEQREGLSLLYGHTVGHALESASCGRLSHCEAVALGMIVAARISCSLGFGSRELPGLHEDLCVKLGVDASVPKYLPPGLVLEHLLHDKKRYMGQVHFALIRAVGELASSGAGYAHIVPGPVIADALHASY